jgi:predicted Zn-dependent protease
MRDVFRTDIVPHKTRGADITCFLVGDYDATATEAAGEYLPDEQVCVVVDEGNPPVFDYGEAFIGVMAHEIAHVAACHAARSRTRGQLLNFVSVPLMVVGGPLGSALYEALSVAAPIMLMTFTRRFESEADFLAVQYMYKAGYDPQALAGFLERISSLESTTDDPVTKAFSSHPEMVQRIERIQREIASLLPARPEYKVDTSEFQEVKLRLSQAEQRTGAPAQGMFVPTLKRRSAPPELHLY